MIARLGDYIKEYSVRNKNSDEIPVYSVTNTQGFCQDYFGKEVASKDKSTYKIVPRGCFAYNPSRINVGSVDWQRNEDMVIVSPLYNVFSVSKELNQQYLYYYLKSDYALQRINNVATGSVRNNLKLTMLYEFPIKLPGIDKQTEIVSILDKTKSIIDLRKNELQKYDELLKARFVEMFGDPVINPYGLPMITLGELSELITKGASPSWQGFSYTDDNSQTLFVTSENVREGYLDLSSPKYIEDGFNEKQKRSMIYKGDFLINIVGASIGRAAQFNLNCKANMNQAAALVRVNDDRIRDKYLLIYLNSEKAQHMYNSMKSDTGRANLSLQDINDLSIMIPPVDKQIEYELFVEQVDKSKVAVRKAFDEAQLLFDSLMQEYFG